MCVNRTCVAYLECPLSEVLLYARANAIASVASHYNYRALHNHGRNG